MKVECPRCHTHVEKPAGGDPVCPTCGFGSDSPRAIPPPAEPRAEPTSSWAPPATGNAWDTEPKAQLNQTMAIVALVLGIVGCCFLGPLTGIPAAIVGGIAMKKAKRQPEEFGGYGMALAGLILGIIATVIGILTAVFYGVLIAAVIDCEANPDTEFCRDLEAGNEPAPTYAAPWATGAPLAAIAPFVMVPRRHAG